MGYSLDEIDPVVSLKQIVTDCTGILVRSLVTATRRRPMRLHVGKTRGGGGGDAKRNRTRVVVVDIASLMPAPPVTSVSFLITQHSWHSSFKFMRKRGRAPRFLSSSWLRFSKLSTIEGEGREGGGGRGKFESNLPIENVGLRSVFRNCSQSSSIFVNMSFSFEKGRPL